MHRTPMTASFPLRPPPHISATEIESPPKSTLICSHRCSSMSMSTRASLPPPVPTTVPAPLQPVPMPATLAAPTSPATSLFKLEKISIKKIDFGEAIDTRKEADLINDLLKQTATLTVNLKPPAQQQQQPQQPIRVTPSRVVRSSETTTNDSKIPPPSNASGLLSTYSFNCKSSSNSLQKVKGIQQTKSDHELGRKLHSFKVSNEARVAAAAAAAMRSGSKSSLIYSDGLSSTVDNTEINQSTTTAGAVSSSRSRSSSSNLDTLSFGSVKELISRFESSTNPK